LGGAVTKKSVLALVVIFALFSIISEVQLVNWANANPYPYTNCDSSFVTVSIISPENKTYNTNNIFLTVTAGAYPGVWGVSYSVDGSPFIGINPENYFGHGFEDSVWINNLSKGSHNITVEAVAPDSNSFVTAYSWVYFTITTDLDPLPSPEPSPTPTTFTKYQPSEKEVVIAIAIIVAVFALGLSLLIHLLRKHF